MKARVPGCGCVPYFPVGARAYHSKFCEMFPNSPLSSEQEAAWHERKRSLAHHPSAQPGTGQRRPLTLVERARAGDDYSDYWSDRDDDGGR